MENINFKKINDISDNIIEELEDIVKEKARDYANELSKDIIKNKSYENSLELQQEVLNLTMKISEKLMQAIRYRSQF